MELHEIKVENERRAADDPNKIEGNTINNN